MKSGMSPWVCLSDQPCICGTYPSWKDLLLQHISQLNYCYRSTMCLICLHCYSNIPSFFHIACMLVRWFDYAQQYRRSPACLVVGIIASVCQPVCAFSICKRNWYSHYHDRVETACGSHSVMGEQLSSISSLQLQSWCS